MLYAFTLAMQVNMKLLDLADNPFNRLRLICIKKMHGMADVSKADDSGIADSWKEAICGMLCKQAVAVICIGLAVLNLMRLALAICSTCCASTQCYPACTLLELYCTCLCMAVCKQ